MPNLDHIMPNPRVVPILWGHDYIANPTVTAGITKLVSDLVTGPFMNGLAQYGVRRGSVMTPIIIDDMNPPATITWWDSNNQFVDEITKKLISWINAGKVPPPPSPPADINQLYLIIPPSETTPQTYGGPADPIGNGAQGWHNEGNTNPPSPPTYYWAIVKTNDCGPPSSGITFVNNFATKVAHELAEQLSDRNGSFQEIGDPCNNTSNFFNYRGWNITQYWSNYDNGCIRGDQPPPMPRSFQTVDNYVHVFVLGTDGKLWLESPPFGVPPPKRQQVDGNVFTFEALGNDQVLVLGTDSNLWLEQAPFGVPPPKRQQVDGNVMTFQGINSQSIFVLGIDGNLWLEQAPFGPQIPPPKRQQIDANVLAFQALDINNVLVLGTDGKLWLEQAPFVFPPKRQQVDGNVRAFSFGPGGSQEIFVLGQDGNLWLESPPFGPQIPPKRQQIDANVLAFQVIYGVTFGVYVVVLRTDGNLWLESLAGFPPKRQQVDGNVMEFTATDIDNILVLGTDGNLWLEQAPFGPQIPPSNRQKVDGNVA